MKCAAPILALFLLTSTGLGGSGAFPDRMYTHNDWKSFLALPAVRLPIEETPDLSLLNASVFYHSCRFRENQGRKAFSFSPALRDAAAYQSAAMARGGFLGHVDPGDRAMSTPDKRIRHFGMNASSLGENVASTFLLDYESGARYWLNRAGDEMQFFRTARRAPGDRIRARTYAEFGEAVVAQLAASPPHRKNLLNPRYTQLGCAAVPSPVASTQIPQALITQAFAAVPGR
jgi:uncharacterized protein YkwD